MPTFIGGSLDVTFRKTERKCPKCEEFLYCNENILYTSNPPKFRYDCNNCQHVEYAVIEWRSEESIK